MEEYTKFKGWGRNEFIGFGSVLALLLILIFLGSFFDLSFLNKFVENAGVWAPLVFILAKASTIVFAPLSGTPLYVLVGTLFGVGEGILYAFLGDLLGFSILFFLSRKYGLAIIYRLTNKDDIEVVKTIQKYTGDVKSFIKVCLTFFWFPEATMIAVGLGKLPYSTVMLVFMPIYTATVSVIIAVSTFLLA